VITPKGARALPPSASYWEGEYFRGKRRGIRGAELYARIYFLGSSIGSKVICPKGRGPHMLRRSGGSAIHVEPCWHLRPLRAFAIQLSSMSVARETLEVAAADIVHFFHIIAQAPSSTLRSHSRRVPTPGRAYPFAIGGTLGRKDGDTRASRARIFLGFRRIGTVVHYDELQCPHGADSARRRLIAPMSREAVCRLLDSCIGISTQGTGQHATKCVLGCPTRLRPGALADMVIRSCLATELSISYVFSKKRTQIYIFHRK